jgi:hypothetical protein
MDVTFPLENLAVCLKKGGNNLDASDISEKKIKKKSVSSFFVDNFHLLFFAGYLDGYLFSKDKN